MNKSVNDFLMEYSAKPVDNGFTERVMEHIPERKIQWGKIKWGTILQYACYLAALIVFVFCGGKELLDDILTAPADRIGFTARIMKDGIYIILFGLSIGTYAVYNVIESEK